MSLASLLPLKKLQAMTMSRWRPAPGQPAPRKPARRPLIEGLELRCMLSVTALTETDSDSFGPEPPNFSGSLTLNQFNASTGVLVGAEVSYSVSMSTSFDGDFVNNSNSSGTANVALNGTTDLNVPGAAGNPQTASVSASDSAPFGPFETVAVAGADSDTVSDTVSMTATEANTNGYVGAGTIALAYSSSASVTQNFTGGGSGNFAVQFDTEGEVSASVTYFYYKEATISGLKFEDLNGQNGQEAGENGLGGVTINLVGTAEDIDDGSGTILLAGGAVSLSTVTAGDGTYSFAGLRPGTYTITEVVPTDYTQTFGFSYTITIDVNGQATSGSLTGNDFGNQPDQPTPGGEGLTPGFWKSNATFKSKQGQYKGLTGAAWIAAGYSPNQQISSVFSSIAGSLGNKTLLEGLQLGGGGKNALIRHAIAAVLNAAHPEVDYPLTVDQIKTAVNNVIASNDLSAIEDLKDELDAFNNFGANLDQHGRAT